MYIEIKWNGCVTKLINPILWIKASRHSYLIYIFTKSTNV